MEKNPNYWDQKEVNLLIINAKVVKDVQAGVSLFEAGEIDIVQINSEYVDKFKDSKDFKLFSNAATIFLTTNKDRKQIFTILTKVIYIINKIYDNKKADP